MEKKEYGNDSIRSLSDREAVRMRVSTYAGGSDKQGAFTTVREIISNAVDEFKTGNGKEVEVIYNEDLSITVVDKGRGVPMDWNESEQKFNYELIFFELNAGGKYSADSYEYSIGLNGIGSSLVTLSSEYANIQSVRDGYVYRIESQKGIIVGEMTKEKNVDGLPNGTTVTWKPDLEVFEEIDFPEEWFVEYMEQQAVVNKGLKLIFESKVSGELSEFEYENGIVDYAKEIGKDKNLTDFQYFETGDVMGKDRDDRKEYKSKYEVVFSFNNDYPTMESYHNSSYLKQGGSPHDAIKTAFVYAIDRLIKDLGKYNKKEKKINFDNIKDSLLIITNTYSTETSYSNQTKFSITNRFIKDFLANILKEKLETYFIENPIEAERIANQVLVNKRSSDKAEETRTQMKKKLSGTVNNITGRVDGFINCTGRNKENNEVFIVEGKSALGSTKQGRDKNTQAIYAIRGKILNCIKADYDRIFKSDVIVDLIKILGCGVEVQSKRAKDMNTFDINNLKWSKVIITTDGDVDGQHIRTLLLTFFHRLMPELIAQGKVFIAESPLFEIQKDDVSHFAYSEKEKDSILKELKSGYTIQRSKGLGENTAQMMWDTTMNPETRRLIKVTPDDFEETQRYFDLFLGDNLDGRKQFIEENLHLYMDELD